MPLTAEVAVADAALTYDKAYTYLVPALLEGHIFVGSLVLAPFGRGGGAPRLGVVTALRREEAPGARLKTLWDAAPREAALPEELLALVKHLRETAFCTTFDALRAVLPRAAQYKAVRRAGGWALEERLARGTEPVYSQGAAAAPARLSPKQRAVLAFVAQGPKSRDEICESCGVSAGVADNLAAKGLLLRDKRARAVKTRWEEPFAPGAAPPARYELSGAQRRVAAALEERMAGQNPKPALLYGVTGSGKTPVFIELARAALAKGKTALVLVPEIGLTPQMAAVMRAAFAGQVAVQHSALADGERLAQWRAVREGRLRVVVGTRSAVFAPLENIGLIVVDEEQERSYQSETAPRYDAVDVARRRAARHGALLLLASATPSVQSFYAARRGRYGLYTLKERYGSVPLPAVEMADMAAEWTAGNTGPISRRLAQAMKETVAFGGQVILLLNRRGYHRVALCRACGKALQCGDCSVPMVLHKGANAEDFLLCHHCGKALRPAPAACPGCGGELRFAGFGTQKLEEELAAVLPGARVLRMDMDSAARKGAHAAMLRRFAAGEYDVLLGTQMVAKGLDFERVKLVGVVGIDPLLFAQGYRAWEQVFSLVTQVVGRSGRAPRARAGAQPRACGPAGGEAGPRGQRENSAPPEAPAAQKADEPGRAIIQTVDPQNPVLLLAARQDYEAFYNEEIAFRRLALYPPFCALCVVGFASADAAAALAAARRFSALLAARAEENPGIPLRVLGPSPMQVGRVAGSYRYRLTLKCKNDEAFRLLAWQALEGYNREGWPRKAAVWLDFHSDG